MGELAPSGVAMGAESASSPNKSGRNGKPEEEQVCDHVAMQGARVKCRHWECNIASFGPDALSLTTPLLLPPKIAISFCFSLSPLSLFFGTSSAFWCRPPSAVQPPAPRAATPPKVQNCMDYLRVAFSAFHETCKFSVWGQKGPPLQRWQRHQEPPSLESERSPP